MTKGDIVKIKHINNLYSIKKVLKNGNIYLNEDGGYKYTKKEITLVSEKYILQSLNNSLIRYLKEKENLVKENKNLEYINKKFIKIFNKMGLTIYDVKFILRNFHVLYLENK